MVMNPVETLETAKAANPLTQLQTFGQSIWLDYIRRDLLQGGDLQRLITEDGLRGMTSNPAIFWTRSLAAPTSTPRAATSYWPSAIFRTRPTCSVPCTRARKSATAM